jgi:hypothetical protein
MAFAKLRQMVEFKNGVILISFWVKHETGKNSVQLTQQEQTIM